MDFEYIEEVTSGLISILVAIAVTYAASIVFPTSNLGWALIAVGFASFFSGFFGRYYGER
ncbi:MAG: hypothetical protein SVY41_01930 [Candidatus Nanohaloarchaea archaeon]|nr:hypothetical protein [Candidatus Nanohaloarchaea archaeon]